MSDEEGNICPFCREPLVVNYNDHVKRLQKLTNNGNANAYYMLGIYYANELMGVQQDWKKANELYLKAGGLLDVQWDIITWVYPITKELVWKWIKRKLIIFMSLQQ